MLFALTQGIGTPNLGIDTLIETDPLPQEGCLLLATLDYIMIAGLIFPESRSFQVVLIHSRNRNALILVS